MDGIYEDRLIKKLMDRLKMIQTRSNNDWNEYINITKIKYNKKYNIIA